MTGDYSRPKIVPGLWKRTEGLLESETSYENGQGIEERSSKLLKAVKEGVKHIE